MLAPVRAEAPVCVLHRDSIRVFAGDGTRRRCAERPGMVGANCDRASESGDDVAVDVRNGDADAGLNGGNCF